MKRRMLLILGLALLLVLLLTWQVDLWPGGREAHLVLSR